VRGVFALTLVVSAILILLALSSSFFSVDRMNISFLDYRNALYQSYLAHDIEYSLHRVMHLLRSECTALTAAGEGDKCPELASKLYSSFVASWLANGVSISGGGISVAPTADGIDVRLSSELHWQKGEYSGEIPAGYGG